MYGSFKGYGECLLRGMHNVADVHIFFSPSKIKTLCIELQMYIYVGRFHRSLFTYILLYDLDHVMYYGCLLQNIVSFIGLFCKRDLRYMTWCKAYNTYICEKRHMMWYDSFICVTWPIHVTHMNEFHRIRLLRGMHLHSVAVCCNWLCCSCVCTRIWICRVLQCVAVVCVAVVSVAVVCVHVYGHA